MAGIPVKDDPRFQLGAYVTNGKHLREVVSQKTDAVVMEDCVDGTRWLVERRLFGSWELAKAAPARDCPDCFEFGK